MSDPGTQLTLDDALYIEENGDAIESSDNSSPFDSPIDGEQSSSDGDSNYYSW